MTDLLSPAQRPSRAAGAAADATPPATSAGSRIRRRSAALLLALVAVLGVAGCSRAQPGSAPSTAASAYRGDALPQPVVLSAADRQDTFQASTGGTTTLAQLQQGRLMLLYFGYTHCPDVCPTTMADLGSALRQLPVIVQGHTQVVFVTSDPARDSPAVMKAWLANFDQGLPRPFIGLTASVRQIDAVAKSVGVPLSPPVTEPNGTITVEHGAQTLAFIGGQASVLWTAGTSPADYAHDISELINHVGSSTPMSPATPSATTGSTAHIGALQISGAFVPQPASPDVAAAYLTIRNGGTTPAVLQRVTTDVATKAMPMTESDSGGTGSMSALGPVRIAAGATFTFRPDHAHLMLEGLTRPLRAGDHIRISLVFEHLGTATLTVPVVPLSDLPGSGTAMSMAPAATPHPAGNSG